MTAAKRKIGFWGTVSCVLWILIGYPISLLFARRRPWETGEHLPAVSILVPTYSEWESLPGKLASLSALDYPSELVEVIVSVDGDAGLVDLARDHAPTATVVLNEQRAGKPSALNLGLASVTKPFVLLTDAHNPLDVHSLRAAVRHFEDETVLAVTGRWSETGSLYDRYEDLLRRLETRSGSVAGIFGGFTVVRREHIDVFPSEVVNEDLWLLCRLVRRGGRVVYDPAASSREGMLSSGNEIERRTRIAAGRTILLPEMGDLPASYLWRLVSHKLGRLALPFLLAGALSTSIGLARRPRYRLAALAQLAVYGIGAAEAAGHTPAFVPAPAARAFRQFLLGNYAAAAGVIRAIVRGQPVTWRQVR